MKLAPTKLTTGHPSSHCGYAFVLLHCCHRAPTSSLISGHLISTQSPPFCLKFGVPKCFPFPLPLSGLSGTVHALSCRFPPERFDPASLEGVQASGQELCGPGAQYTWAEASKRWAEGHSTSQEMQSSLQNSINRKGIQRKQLREKHWALFITAKKSGGMQTRGLK